MKKQGTLYFLLLISTVLSAQTVSFLGTLPDSVKETSGLILYDGKLITHNVSGNTAQLFEIDTLSLMVTRVVNVSNAENIDWEDIIDYKLPFGIIGQIAHPILVKKQLHQIFEFREEKLKDLFGNIPNMPSSLNLSTISI